LQIADFKSRVPSAQSTIETSEVRNHLVALADLLFALIDAFGQPLQHRAGSLQNVISVGVGLSAHLFRFAHGLLMRLIGHLLRALRNHVLGDQLLGVLLCVGDNALGFAARVLNDAVRMIAGILNGAVGLGARITHETLRLGLRFADHAVRFVLRLRHHTVAIARYAFGFFEVVGQRLFELRGLYEKRLFVNEYLAENVALSIFDQHFEFVYQA
jgi:hypothetical protein